MMINLQSQTKWYARAQWGIPVALVAGGLLFYGWCYRPHLREQARLGRGITEHREQLEGAWARTRNLPAIQADIYRIKARLDHNNKTLPRDPELAAFMKDIGNICQQTGVRKFTCQPGAVLRKEPIDELPVTLSFEGDFMGVFQFVRQAEDMLRLTRVRSLAIRSVDPKAGQVDVQMAVILYFSEE